jgi:FkbM family methyltransferase
MIDRNIINQMKIEVVYDIGACHGEWSLMMKKELFPNSKFIMFEANEKNISRLEKSNIEYFIEVLSDVDDKEVTFFCDAKDTSHGDSYYKEKTNLYNNNYGKKIKTITLDTLIEKNNLPLPNFIKIDTQGSELDILNGSKKAIRNVSLILLECPIIEYNENAPNIQNYLSFMKNNNFVPIQLIESHELDGILVQIDIMFMRKDLKEKYLGKTNLLKI